MRLLVTHAAQAANLRGLPGDFVEGVDHEIHAGLVRQRDHMHGHFHGAADRRAETGRVAETVD
ncbi:hypothetical protein D3C83_216040 [compost metagenome]